MYIDVMSIVMLLYFRRIAWVDPDNAFKSLTYFTEGRTDIQLLVEGCLYENFYIATCDFSGGPLSGSAHVFTIGFWQSRKLF